MLNAQALAKLWSAAGSAVAASLLIPVGAFAANGRRLLLALIIIDIPLHLGAHLYYSEDAEALGAISGVEISLTTIAFVALYAMWIVDLTTKRELMPSLYVRPCIPLGLYLLFEAVSLVVARNITYSLDELFITTEMLLLYIYLVNWVTTSDDVRFVLRMLFGGFVFEALLMVGLAATGRDVNMHTFHTYVGTENGYSRVGGTLVSPNYAGEYLSMVLALILSMLLFMPRHFRYKAVLVGSFALGIIALMLTYSRGSWLALIAAATVTYAVGWHRIHRRSKVLFGLAYIVIVVVLIVQGPISTRIFGDDEGSASSRFTLMKLAARMIEDHPLVGVGANNFTLYMYDYSTEDLKGEWLFTVHNKLLLVWAETGTGGLAAFLLFVGAIARQAWRCWGLREGFYSAFGLGCLASIVALLVNLMVEPDRGRMALQLLVTMAAMLSAVNSWRSPAGSEPYRHEYGTVTA